jgi:hypothetical protein
VEPEGGDDRVAVRLSPFSPEQLSQNAEGTRADDIDRGIDPPRYGLSVLAGKIATDTSAEAVVEELCNATHLNSNKIAVVSASALREAGFSLVPDPTEKEPTHHLIGVGDLSAPFDAESLHSLLVEGFRKNPRKRRKGA